MARSFVVMSLVAMSFVSTASGTPSARADVSFTAQSPASIVYTRSKRVEYSVTAVNSDSKEALVHLRLTSRDYPGEMPLLRPRYGGPFPPPAFEGPGVPAGVSAGDIDVAGRCGTRVFFHGAGSEDRVVGVRLPPRSTTKVRLPYRLTGRPWPDSDYRLRGVATIESGGATRRVRLGFPKPKIRGRTGVRITLNVQPPRRLVFGSPVRLSGKTLPRLRNKELLIRYLRVALPGRLRTLLRVRTDVHGRFRATVPWPRRRSGRYEVWARYQRQGSGPFGDYTCAWTLRSP